MIFSYIIQRLLETLQKRLTDLLITTITLQKMLGFLKKNKDILIIAGICECCNKKIYNTEKQVECYQFNCHFHKKCFKKTIKESNTMAITMGYKAKFTKKNITCKCGSGF